MDIRTDISRLSENGHRLPAYIYMYVCVHKYEYIQTSVQGEIMSQIQLLQIYVYFSKSKWKNTFKTNNRNKV
jgi:hypothetical protein